MASIQDPLARLTMMPETTASKAPMSSWTEFSEQKDLLAYSRLLIDTSSYGSQ